MPIWTNAAVIDRLVRRSSLACPPTTGPDPTPRSPDNVQNGPGFSPRGPLDRSSPQSKTPRGFPGAFAVEVSLAVTYFRVRNAHYHRRLSVSRSCSGWEGVGPEGYCHQAFRWSAAGVAQGDASRDAFGKSSRSGVVFDAPPRKGAGATSRLRGYRIKPHGQLVPVSSTPYSASTSGLST